MYLGLDANRVFLSSLWGLDTPHIRLKHCVKDLGNKWELSAGVQIHLPVEPGTHWVQRALLAREGSESLWVKTYCSVFLKSHQHPYFQQWAAPQMPPFLLGALKAKPTGKWDPGKQIPVCPLASLRHISGTPGMTGLACLHLPACCFQHWPWPHEKQVQVLGLQQGFEPQPHMQWGTAPAVRRLLDTADGCLSSWHCYTGRSNLNSQQGEGTEHLWASQQACGQCPAHCLLRTPLPDDWTREGGKKALCYSQAGPFQPSPMEKGNYISSEEQLLSIPNSGWCPHSPPAQSPSTGSQQSLGMKAGLWQSVVLSLHVCTTVPPCSEVIWVG